MGARKLNLLVLDDDPSIVRLVVHTIETQLADRTAVVGMSDPAAALEWIEQNCCDILLTDIEMPDMDGLEMLRFAKSRNAWTQVIFITAHTTWDRITAAVESGASDYLLKPLDCNEIVRVMEHQFARFARWQSAVMGTIETGVGAEGVLV